eukprot:symbB.v1.2.023503.t1/scaffold2074.1/size157288/3
MAAILTVQVLAALAFWIAMSASMIIFNAALLRDFRHPVWLTFWHQSVSSCLVFMLRLIKPSLVSTGDDEDGRPALTVVGAMRIGVPVAAAQCVGLIAGNTAVMYISVSFCQMIKAWTPTCVYMVGCLVGTQKWSSATAKTLATITTGLMITSVGELKFEWYGFCMQCTALLSEGVRINLLEMLLKSSGFKLNPLSSVMVFAPFASSILLVIGLVTDPDAIRMEVVQNIGELALFVNALIAFLLNIAIYIAIQVASGLIYALAGIVKDMSKGHLYYHGFSSSDGQPSRSDWEFVSEHAEAAPGLTRAPPDPAITTESANPWSPQMLRSSQKVSAKKTMDPAWQVS